MQPWALRNVLDAFSGALPGTGYSFDTPLYNPTGTQVSSHGFSFHHDMGLWPNSGTGPAYGANMGDEELQAWILSAGLYWRHTGRQRLADEQRGRAPDLPQLHALEGPYQRRGPRDGITKNVNAGEITTLRQPGCFADQAQRSAGGWP
ncbi:MAG: hypothetical protein V9H26_17765 [Verrucomicrobiota bacterium]